MYESETRKIEDDITDGWGTIDFRKKRVLTNQ